MEYLNNETNAGIVLNIIDTINANKVYLSEIDGKIGDGDHGVNMSKGFTMAGEQITSYQSFSDAMKILGDTLLFEIGGSMGPIYGTFFRTCSKTIRGHSEITIDLFVEMLSNSLREIQEIGGARVGDKTLIDTLSPTVSTLKEEITAGETFKKALVNAGRAAEAGKDSTLNMVAKIGRAARLHERSVGVLDAGATSCYLILKAMFDAASAVILKK